MHPGQMLLEFASHSEECRLLTSEGHRSHRQGKGSRDVDKSIDSLESTTDNSSPEPVSAPVKSSRKPKAPLAAPSSRNLMHFMNLLVNAEHRLFV